MAARQVHGRHVSPSHMRRLRMFLLVLAVAVSGTLLFLLARVSLAVYQLQDSLSVLRVLAAGPSALEFPALASELRRLDQSLAVLETTGAQLGPLASPLAAFLAGLPAVGPAAEAAQDLLPVAGQSVSLARRTLGQVRPHLEQMPPQAGAPAFDGHAAVALATSLGSDTALLAADYESLAEQAARAAAHDGLPAPLRRPLHQLAQGLQLGAAAATLGPHLQWLLGMDSPRTLLIVAQNNDELRATGGFISAAGTVTVDKGQVALNDIVDSHAIDREDVELPPAPAPLQQYMQAKALVFRDANWWPDAPASAQTVADLYMLNTGVQVDGVLLLDTNALAHLVQALGAVTLPGRGVTLSAADLEQQLIAFWNPQPLNDNGELAADPMSTTPAAAGATLAERWAWWSQRKSFIPEVAQAVLLRVQSGDEGASALAALSAAVVSAFDDRSLQLWVRDAGAAAALHELGWDGALVPRPGADFLAVVDSNVGFNKVDSVMERSMDYQVAWPPSVTAEQASTPVATLTLTYTHSLAASDPGCDPTSRYGSSYANMTKRCYFDYVRVYVPDGSKLKAASGLQPDTTTSGAGEKGLQVFAGYFVQPPGSVYTVSLTYELPLSLQPEDYALVIQRQAGTEPLPVTLRIGQSSATTVLHTGRLEWQPTPGNTIRSTSASTGYTAIDPTNRVH